MISFYFFFRKSEFYFKIDIIYNFFNFALKNKKNFEYPQF